MGKSVTGEDYKILQIHLRNANTEITKTILFFLTLFFSVCMFVYVFPFWQLCSQFLIPFCSPTSSQNLSLFPRHIQSRGRFPFFLGCVTQGLTYQSSPACHQSTPQYNLPMHSITGQWKVAQSGLTTESLDHDKIKATTKKDHLPEENQDYYYWWYLSCTFVLEIEFFLAGWQ